MRCLVARVERVVLLDGITAVLPPTLHRLIVYVGSVDRGVGQ
ncbi:hypothetical protein E2C01_088995 [Portunus trituberculatus]|uniref:Uncharacterized protein n=1 Tax=Portunus trituberculatus TaxID=210409 RepID=A0A5B7JAU0_PORTR|nr:hypothetical protein [Portunus trituberculatus]